MTAPVKKISSALLTSVLLLTAFSLTQAALAGEGTRPSSTAVRGIELSGKLSDDGKSIVADDDNTWHITNAELVKGLEGRFVVVKCRMDVNKRTIHVIGVINPAQNMHMAHLGDAAFRR